MSFEAVRDQAAVTGFLRKAWAGGRLPHALLFAGQRGVGKTMTALALARLKFCRRSDPAAAAPCGTCEDCLASAAGAHPDLVQLLNDPLEPHIRIGDPDDDCPIPPEDLDRLHRPLYVRELLFALQRSSSRGGGKFVLVQNAEKLNSEAANALLKAVEEPPPGTLFVLTTEDLEQAIGTIVSRCQVVRFGAVRAATIAALLTEERALPAAVADRAAGLARGSVTRAREIIDNKILPVRDWLHGRLTAPGAWDIPALTGELLRQAPGLVHGFDDSGEPRRVESRTKHPAREGLREFLAMMLEHCRDLSLRVQGLDPEVYCFEGNRTAAAADLPAAEELDAAASAIMDAMQAVDRNVNFEMVLDGVLARLNTQLQGVPHI
jgi:DNA polymerase III delta prime subunit